MSGHEHNHEHSADGLNTTRELVLIGVALTLLAVGSIFRETLHATPYAVGEYAVFFWPTGLAAGMWWPVQCATPLRGRSLMKIF